MSETPLQTCRPRRAKTAPTTTSTTAPESYRLPALEGTSAGTFWADNMGHLSTRPVRGSERITVVRRPSGAVGLERSGRTFRSVARDVLVDAVGR
jgi:hypothetical protein